MKLFPTIVLLTSLASASALASDASQPLPEVAASAPVSAPPPVTLPVPATVPALVPAPRAAPLSIHYLCEGGVSIEAVYPPPARASDPVTLSWLGGQATLKIARSASGVRYVNRSYVWWTKGDSAFLSTRGGRMLVRNCHTQQLNMLSN